MTIVEVKSKTTYANALTFIQKNDYQKEFEEIMDIPFEEWELGEGIADQTLIEEILDKKEELYLTKFIPENIGYIEVFKISLPKVQQ